MWVRFVLDISELTMPLEDYINGLVENGFVFEEHIEEKQELVVKRHITRLDYFKMSLFMVKEYIKGKFDILKKKITPTLALIKRKLFICRDKIKSGFSKFRSKISNIFRRRGE